MVDFSFLKGKKKPAAKPAKPAALPACEGCESAQRKAALYWKIIERYRDTIEATEAKSITDLRALIVPENPVVRKIAAEVKSGFRPYIPEHDEISAAYKAFEYCKGLKNELIEIEYWLTPEEMVDLKAADEIDKAILLCSVLRALEIDAKVLVATEEKMRHGVVIFEAYEKFYWMDPTHDVLLSGEREEIVSTQIKDVGSRLIYEFTEQGYIEW